MAIGRTNAGGGGNLTGDAAVGDVLAGKTFYNTDPHAKQTGTLPDKSGQSVVAAAGDISGGQYRLLAPAAAKYSSGTRLQRPQANVAVDIGLTAEKLVKGNTVLGIDGIGQGNLIMEVIPLDNVTRTVSTNKKTVTYTINGLPHKPMAVAIRSYGEYPWLNANNNPLPTFTIGIASRDGGVLDSDGVRAPKTDITVTWREDGVTVVRTSTSFEFWSTWANETYRYMYLM
jgi:hypothetical protein